MSASSIAARAAAARAGGGARRALHDPIGLLIVKQGQWLRMSVHAHSGGVCDGGRGERGPHDQDPISFTDSCALFCIMRMLGVMVGGLVLAWVAAGPCKMLALPTPTSNPLNAQARTQLGTGRVLL